MAATTTRTLELLSLLQSHRHWTARELVDRLDVSERTLRVWRDAFHARLDRVRALGFDERFVRKWHYYLCYCEAAFALRNISVVQTVHTRPNNLAL